MHPLLQNILFNLTQLTTLIRCHWPAIPQEPPAPSHTRLPSGCRNPLEVTRNDLNLVRETETYFGDIISKKRNNILRIGFQNIGGFSLDNNCYKDELLWKGANKYNFILGLAETNTDWKLINESGRLYSRTRGWWEALHISLSHNCTAALIRRQQWGALPSSVLTKRLIEL
jgi:hypothetical protein